MSMFENVDWKSVRNEKIPEILKKYKLDSMTVPQFYAFTLECIFILENKVQELEHKVIDLENDLDLAQEYMDEWKASV